MNHKFNEKIKDIRIAKNILQKDISEFLQVSLRQYQRWEKGEQDPSLSNAVALADYFDVSIDYLVGRSDDPNRH